MSDRLVTDLVFICSPYSDDDIEKIAENARRAAAMCDYASRQDSGCIPVAPHVICSQWWKNDEVGKFQAMGYSKSLLPLCRVMYAWAGCKPTEGMMEEMHVASVLGITIIFVTEDELDLTPTGDLMLVPNKF